VDEGQLDALDSFLSNENLELLAVAIKLVIRGFPPVKWREEFLRLNIPSSLISRLIDIASSLPTFQF
jgi:hypothetical protein